MTPSPAERRGSILFDLRRAFAWRHLRRFLVRNIPLFGLLGVAAIFLVASGLVLHQRLNVFGTGMQPTSYLVLAPVDRIDSSKCKLEPHPSIDAAGDLVPVTWESILPPQAQGLALWSRSQERFLLNLQNPNQGKMMNFRRMPFLLRGEEIIVTSTRFDPRRRGTRRTTQVTRVHLSDGAVVRTFELEGSVNFRDVSPNGRLLLGQTKPKFLRHARILPQQSAVDLFHQPILLDLETGMIRREPIRMTGLAFVNDGLLLGRSRHAVFTFPVGGKRGSGKLIYRIESEADETLRITGGGPTAHSRRPYLMTQDYQPIDRRRRQTRFQLGSAEGGFGENQPIEVPRTKEISRDGRAWPTWKLAHVHLGRSAGWDRRRMIAIRETDRGPSGGKSQKEYLSLLPDDNESTPTYYPISDRDEDLDDYVFITPDLLGTAWDPTNSDAVPGAFPSFLPVEAVLAYEPVDPMALP